jgi:hypothetical protein
MFNNQANLFGLGIATHQQPGKEKSQFDFFRICYMHGHIHFIGHDRKSFNPQKHSIFGD